MYSVAAFIRNHTMFIFEKNHNKKNAQKHVTQVDLQCHDDVEYSIKHTEIFDNRFKASDKVVGSTDNIHVANIDTVQSILLCSKRGKVMALNYASYNDPGGKFLEGWMAQEESLCYRSDLYNVLRAFKKEYFDENVKRQNYGLYYNRALYTPDIVFFGDDDYQCKADIISCAAPNKAVADEHTVLLDTNNNAVISRINFMVGVAAEHQPEIAIFGAWGCGNFKQNPKFVANVFKKTLQRYYLREVVFAIPASIDRANYRAFMEVFS